MTTARKRTPGISRIDQLEKRTHGFFVRLRRKGKMYSGFFADKSHGGKRQALAAAQKYYQQLLKKHRPMTRQLWAEIVRRRGPSGIVGVQRVILKKGVRKQVYWKATWSPKPYVVRRKTYSVRKYGAKRAKALALRARQQGVRSMAG